ncbi:MAG TPA: DMT family transporter [Bacilli bacterium]|nr:DMT family transporter [Bacilli bacterium]
MKARDLIILFALAALWGASFLFMRVSAPVLGPVMLIELRVALAALALLVYLVLTGQRMRILHKWKPYLILGAVNAALPFCLIATAELHVSASLAAILNATTPLFTALVAWGWAKDAFTLKKSIGLLMGIIGVAILVGWDVGGGSAQELLLSVGCSLLAALCYGIAGVFSAKYFKGEKPLDMAVGQQLAAALVLLPFSLFAWPHQVPGADVVFSVLVLAVVCTAFAYLLYFGLIQNVGAVKTLSVTFLVPVFGIIWGALFLGEAMTVGGVIGLVIILLSVALVTNVPLPFRKANPAVTRSKM